MEKLNLVIFSADEVVSNLCKEYWNVGSDLKFNNTVKSLTEVAGLTQKQFLQLIIDECDSQSTEIFCQDCEIPYIFISRNDFLEKQRSLNWYLQNWLCADCSLERKRQEEQEKANKVNNYRQLITQSYSSEPAQIVLEALSLELAVYLLSFIRFCANEDLTCAKPLGATNFHESLSPQNKFDYDILRSLYHEGIIKVYPGSPIEAFSGDRAETFYLDKVFWILPVLPNTDHPKFLAMRLEEMFRINSFPHEWFDESLQLWRKIALNECLQYLENSLAEHNLSLTVGEKTTLVINSLLEDYSVGQIFNMIWRSAKDAAAFLVRKEVTKQHAANTVVGAIQRYGENAKVQGWEVKSYRRPFNCPQSMISQVFFDSVLKIGEAGFNQVPFTSEFEDLSDIDEIDKVQ